MTSKKTEKMLEVGDRMRDGTVVVAVDPKKNVALFAPEDIFGGESEFYHQDDVVNKANDQGLSGHKDWRRVTDKEAGKLAKDWGEVAPPALRDEPTEFWGAYSIPNNWVLIPLAHLYCGGKAEAVVDAKCTTHHVPIIRSGPAKF